MDLNTIAVDSIREAVSIVIAQSLTDDTKNAVITKAVTEVLAGYSGQDVLKKLILGRIELMAAKVLEEGRYDQTIMDAVATGFQAAVEKSRAVAEKALVIALCGEHRPGYSARTSVMAEVYDKMKT